jgi:hypothetical protein
MVKDGRSESEDWVLDDGIEEMMCGFWGQDLDLGSLGFFEQI